MRALAEAVLTRCRDKKLMLATAESCTGGLIAGALTDIAGSSDVVERGFVTYSNRAKTEMLGVPAALIAWHGAVSAEVARAMAAGALAHAPVDLTVAVTGIAGPGGGSADKPVGLIHLATARRGGKPHSEHQIFPGDRTAIRRATVERALELLQAAAEQ
ncbi:MAG TPA: CinA family protein [Stellaceae bacterium]|nr:CinA family protein [Stellaceae bacterium]